MERAMLTHPAVFWCINRDLDSTTAYGTKMRPHDHSVPIAESQQHIINPTNSGRACDDGIQDWLHVRRRAADDTEHFGCRRLMLQCFAQLCIALLQFLEQSYVLNGYHRLVS